MSAEPGTTCVGPAADADLAACAALVAGHALFERYGIGPTELVHALRSGVAAGDLVSCARRGSVLVGFVWLAPTGAFARSPYLRLLAVAPETSGTGIGSQLAEAAEVWAFRRASDIFLLVNDGNVAARRFYTRRGFEVVGRLHEYVLPGLDETIMRKRRPTTND